MNGLVRYCIWSGTILGVIGAAVLAGSGRSAAPVVAATATAAMNPGVEVCVLGWSKDHCEGELTSDNVRDLTCFNVTPDGEVIECRTIYVRDAVLKFPVRASLATCDNAADIPCDEVRHLNGTLTIDGDWTFRGQESCRFRGCWSGEWKLQNTNGQTIASGRGSGPLGTGSHRVPTCPTNLPCNPNCERCYEVQFVVSPIGGTWVVDLEGCLNGTVADNGPYPGAQICVSISGELRTPGSDEGPFNFGAWRFCGTSDGTVLDPCEILPH